jgi:hypothetical protein
VEWRRQAAAAVARAKYGYAAWILCYNVECGMLSDLHARHGRTGTQKAFGHN